MSDTDRHYHVVAVQDSGKYWRCWDAEPELDVAKHLADDVIRADQLWWHRADQAFHDEFGDRTDDLVSTCVNPGWEAVWLVPCGDPCDFADGRLPGLPGWEPYWIAPHTGSRYTDVTVPAPWQQDNA